MGRLKKPLEAVKGTEDTLSVLVSVLVSALVSVLVSHAVTADKACEREDYRLVCF